MDTIFLSVFGALFRSVLRSIWLAVSLFLAGGCAGVSGYPDHPGKPEKEAISLARYFDEDSPESKKYESAEPEKRTAERNHIIFAQLRAIDINYALFEQAMAREGVIANIGTDWSVISVNAVGALVGTSQAKSVLHAISGGIVAFKGSVDKNAYYDKTIPALMTQMQANRLKVRLEIMTKLQSPDEEYPLMAAKTDVDRYFAAGTIPGAIQQIVETAGNSANRSSAALATLVLPSDKDIARRSALKTIIHDLAENAKSSDATKKSAAVAKLIAASKKLAADPAVSNVDALADGATPKAAGDFADQAATVLANSIHLSGAELDKTLTALEAAFAD